MDNVQNCDSYINMPSSQTYGSIIPYISAINKHVAAMTV
jgi:hypothetical protein